MDIGNQQRVIIVEPDQLISEEELSSTVSDVGLDLETAAAWPLPLDLDPEPVL
jgi:hypothetical protein